MNRILVNIDSVVVDGAIVGDPEELRAAVSRGIADRLKNASTPDEFAHSSHREALRAHKQPAGSDHEAIGHAIGEAITR